MVGENGASVQIGVDLPPKTLFYLPYDKQIRHTFSVIKEEILDEIPDMFFQPNDVELTPFPKSEEEFDKILEIIEKHKAELANVNVYRNIDSFDFVPKGIDKFSGMKMLCEYLGITNEEVLTVGNGENDYPMFDFSVESVGVNLKDKSRAKHNFDSIETALAFIEKTYISK